MHTKATFNLYTDYFVNALLAAFN